MALKDLVSDLSNFKYGITSPDKVDAQIETGVDFFDNNEGGADGFTPKTDLESLYHKVRDGNVVAGPIHLEILHDFNHHFWIHLLLML